VGQSDGYRDLCLLCSCSDTRRLSGVHLFSRPSSPLASRLETPLGRSFIHVEIFTSHEVGKPIFGTSLRGARGGVRLIRRHMVVEDVARRRLCRPALSPSTPPVFPFMLASLVIAIPLDVGLDFWGTCLGKAGVIFLLLGLFEDSSEWHQIDLATLYRWTKLIAGSKDANMRRNTGRNNTRQKREVFFWRSGNEL